MTLILITGQTIELNYQNSRLFDNFILLIITQIKVLKGCRFESVIFPSLNERSLKTATIVIIILQILYVGILSSKKRIMIETD